MQNQIKHILTLRLDFSFKVGGEIDFIIYKRDSIIFTCPIEKLFFYLSEKESRIQNESISIKIPQQVINFIRKRTREYYYQQFIQNREC